MRILQQIIQNSIIEQSINSSSLNTTLSSNIVYNKKESIYKEITNIYNKGGLLGFMKGFTPRVIRVGKIGRAHV